ncbi:hypothetical protein E2320_006270 [Naja naja]|nr:hypothetical protein E2320_006270 [Naja naja]
MENFEYSIQLNDRDWAEFYFVSEECRLIPPALATAEEQLLGDLEEGEAEDKKGSADHPKASRLPRDVPGGHLLAEDAFSGSEDESDLGSVRSTSNTAISGKLEFPKLRAALDPSSLGVPSVLSPTSGEAEDPEKEVKFLQVALRASFQETHSPSSQEHSVQVRPLLVSNRARTSGKKEEDVPETERGAEDHSRNLSPNTSQEGDQAKDNGVEGCPEVLEEDGSPDPSVEVGLRASATSSGKTERQNNGEPCLHLGLAIQPEGQSPTRTRENPRLVPYHLKSHGCPEETSTNVTWPEVYDYFFLDDLHEVERLPSQEGTSWKTSHGHPSELPPMSGPEMYEYFFQDVGESVIEEETWSEAGPSETLFSSAHGLVSSTDLEELPFNMSTDPMGFPEVYEHFFVHQPQVKSHQRPNILAVPASELKKAVRTLISLRGLFSWSSPRDLCLGFVALASWAVKTSTSTGCLEDCNLLRVSDQQQREALLLANFGTLSAIRCFRRQVVMESYHGS